MVEVTLKFKNKNQLVLKNSVITNYVNCKFVTFIPLKILKFKTAQELLGHPIYQYIIFKHIIIHSN